MGIYWARKIAFIAVLALLLSCDDASMGSRSQEKHKIETVNRQRCSFNVTDKLYLDRIDSSFNPEGYFKIKSYMSENMLQLFVFDTKIDEDDKLNAEVRALNSPDVFIPHSIEQINHFGNYQGKGVVMNGVYSGGVLNGTIKVFCFGEKDKGFLAIRQTIRPVDEKEFDVVENSFTLK